MQTMRYINMLERTSRVRTTKCFPYNNMIVFAVSKDSLSRAIGQNAVNIRRIQDQLGKKVRVIAEPAGIEDAQRFVEDVVSPVKFKSLEVKEGSFILNAGSQSKAALIGRNRRRLDELNRVLEDNFGMGLKII